MTDDEVPIVDAHYHLWDLEGALRYPWLSSGEHRYMGVCSRLRRAYLPPEYWRDSALHKVIATVHVEAECNRIQQLAETEWVSRMAAVQGMPNAIVALLVERCGGRALPNTLPMRAACGFNTKEARRATEGHRSSSGSGSCGPPWFSALPPC